MKFRSTYDVIVIGGGPGGAVAAKRCADSGFKTILVEKKKLPREKVCSGMVMGPWANDIIREEFGDIPPEILTTPSVLSGHMIHVAGSPHRAVDFPTPLAWRKDLDFWMIQKAADSGVDILDRAKAIQVDQRNGTCSLVIKTGKKKRKLETGYIIAADGGASTVRKFLFPKLKVRYSTPLRECYHGSVDMDTDYIHWFFPTARPRPRFDLLHKGDCFVIEGSGLRVLREEIQRVLADHGYDPEQKPAWRDGCLMPLLHNEIISGAFLPAKGNILLLGDAAGLVFPITFEGIGPALKSGILAAEAIEEAATTGKGADTGYLEKLKPVFRIIEKFFYLQTKLETVADKGAVPLADAIQHAYAETLRIA
jgi:flavin-dependent dehydrogenase